MTLQGLFITLEGLDGCGKSTQAKMLAESLVSQGHQVALTREPGGTALAEAIRNLILTPTAEELDPMAEILLYAAARAQHVNSLIKPALAAGQIVICERFVDSSLAYQGYGLGYDLELIRQVNQTAIGRFEPDLTFLLDIDCDQGTRRVLDRSRDGNQQIDRIEARGTTFQARVRQGYLALAQSHPRIQLIQCLHKDIPQVHAEIRATVAAKLTA